MIYFQGKRILSAIFDMDGTMFDTERLRFKTLKQAAMEIFGSPLSDETLTGSLGLSAKRAEALAKANHQSASSSFSRMPGIAPFCETQLRNI